MVPSVDFDSVSPWDTCKHDTFVRNAWQDPSQVGQRPVSLHHAMAFSGPWRDRTYLLPAYATYESQLLVGCCSPCL